VDIANECMGLQWPLYNPNHATVQDTAAPCDFLWEKHIFDALHTRGLILMSFECWVCENEYGSESALSQHLSSAGHYQCYKCERVFGSSTSLGQHIDACHD